MSVMEVVSAAVVKVGADGRRRVLLGQRSPNSSHALCWVTFGGKVESGESWEEALARELHEEADLRATDHEPDAAEAWWRALRKRWTPLYEHTGTSTTTGAPFRVRCFWIGSGTDDFNDLQPGDGIIGLGWFTAEEVAALNLGPADGANRQALVDLLTPAAPMERR